jgi:hypothetical protein
MSAPCDKCGTIVHAYNHTMVMLHDELWQTVNGKRPGVLCALCIEQKLGRKITGADLKLTHGIYCIPVNTYYAEKHNLIYSGYHRKPLSSFCRTIRKKQYENQDK